MRFSLALIATCVATPAFAQHVQPQPVPAWPYPQLTGAAQVSPLPQAPQGVAVPPPPVVAPPSPIPTGLPERTEVVYELPPLPASVAAPGQQHWVSLNLTVLQPFTGRVAVKVLPRAQNSIWLEAFIGSVLFERMYGFGVRMQHTLLEFAGRDRVMFSPGVGVQILPTWTAWEKHRRLDPWGFNYTYWTPVSNSLFYVFGDIDISWLHDFSPHFGFELGVKVGLAGRVGGNIGDDYPNGITWGSSLYPIFALYSGFRF